MRIPKVRDCDLTWILVTGGIFILLFIRPVGAGLAISSMWFLCALINHYSDKPDNYEDKEEQDDIQGQA